MDPRLESLNTLLVETFNAILKVEEQSLRRATRETVTVTSSICWMPLPRMSRLPFHPWPRPPG